MSLAERLLGQDGIHHPQTVESERRLKPRLNEEFRGSVQGIDGAELPLARDCIIQNISASGLYLRGRGDFLPEQTLKVVVQLFIEGQSGSTVETTGRVVRIEPGPDGNHGLAMVINRFKFL